MVFGRFIFCLDKLKLLFFCIRLSIQNFGIPLPLSPKKYPKFEVLGCLLAKEVC